MKAIAWRPKDMDDLATLIDQYPGMDKVYVMEQFGFYAEILEISERVEILRKLLS